MKFFLDNPYLYPRSFPSCLRVVLSIWLLFSGSVLLGSSLSLSSLLKRDPDFLQGLLCDGEQHSWNYYPFLMVSLFLYKEVLAGRFFLLSNGFSFLLPYFLLLCKTFSLDFDYLLTMELIGFEKFSSIHTIGMG